MDLAQQRLLELYLEISRFEIDEFPRFTYVDTPGIGETGFLWNEFREDPDTDDNESLHMHAEGFVCFLSSCLPPSAKANARKLFQNSRKWNWKWEKILYTQPPTPPETLFYSYYLNLSETTKRIHSENAGCFGNLPRDVLFCILQYCFVPTITGLPLNILLLNKFFYYLQFTPFVSHFAVLSSERLSTMEVMHKICPTTFNDRIPFWKENTKKLYLNLQLPDENQKLLSYISMNKIKTLKLTLEELGKPHVLILSPYFPNLQHLELIGNSQASLSISDLVNLEKLKRYTSSLINVRCKSVRRPKWFPPTELGPLEDTYS
jgi:hypothetical protein